MKLQKIFGMPPESHVSESIRKSSLPILEIVPCKPNFQLGLNLFRLKAAWDGAGDNKTAPDYNPILNSHGYELDSKPIKVAFIADNFPTDTFSNEYGESFLNRTSDMVSSGVQELNYMAGGRTASESFKNIKGFADQHKGKDGVAGPLASLVSGISGGAQKGIESLVGMEGKGGLGGFLGASGSVMNKMLGGARIDFPQVWKNSGYTPQYSVTVRLWNPQPGSSKSTEKYIVGPLAALLLLALPLTIEGHTYNWPFLHKIKCRGIFDLQAAYISSVAVVKGGDQQQIAWNQRLGIVDVRIDFGSLYSSMLAGTDYNGVDKPTLQGYLDSMLDKVDPPNLYEEPAGYTNLSPKTTHANPLHKQPLTPSQQVSAEQAIANIKKTAGVPGFDITGRNVINELYRRDPAATIGDPIVTRENRAAAGLAVNVTSGVEGDEIPPSRGNSSASRTEQTLIEGSSSEFYISA